LAGFSRQLIFINADSNSKKEFAMKDCIQKHQLPAFFVLTYAIAFGTTFTYINLQPGQPNFLF
jgi:hypothetical protein